MEAHNRDMVCWTVWWGWAKEERAGGELDTCRTCMCRGSRRIKWGRGTPPWRTGESMVIEGLPETLWESSGIVCGRSNAGSLGHTVMLPGVPTSRELCWLSSTHLYNLLAVQSFHLLPALTEIRESLNISWTDISLFLFEVCYTAKLPWNVLLIL